MAEQKNPVDKLSAQDKARLTKASYLISGMSLFIRWASTFTRYEIKNHPKHSNVKLLSAVQSGRFCLAFTDDAVCLGVQQTEAVWLKDIPLDFAIADDRLYLTVPAVEAIDIKFPTITIGIDIESDHLVQKLKSFDTLSFVEVRVKGGVVSEVIGPLRSDIPLLNDGLKSGLMHHSNVAATVVTMNDFL
ncbi:hypothetical protein [Serratia symbiotica]|uniref:hypothetical protein n=1 Tax=Serratia symbiotica TaxID=138074 RepID=UPI001AE9972B|nr:hypothetical protein [Serratia symbiotica]QTP13411.1 hypothetical protein GPZ83_0000285 [Serratia symbiotica]